MAKPIRNCDLIMKGGITSGVVFPLAIVELSNEFNFKNIGGTSAGAIAAALTAAAEYRRVTQGGTEGFDALATLPTFLGDSTDGEPNLLNLFPPKKETRRLFGVATAFLGDDSYAAKIVRAFGAMLIVSPIVTIACFLPFFGALYVALNHLQTWIGLAGVLLSFVVSAVLLAVVTIAVGVISTLPENGFGFSIGRTPADRKLPGVTDWLTAEIQKTAGIPSSGPLLTFGELKKQGVNLQMMTTALSHGVPYRLPFTNRRFAFNEEEFRRYFPDSVVDFMIAAARAQAALGSEKENDDLVAASDAAPSAADRYYPVPPPDGLPVVVGARMSLSFPVLFCMVPLYAVDYASTAQERKKCWFIDGGLSSNFPISLFDAPLPRWPTFGIDLTGVHPDHPIDDSDPESGIWMVKNNSAGRSEHWLPFGKDGLSIGAYVGAMLDTMRNWHDNAQMSVPGFRDRIVHIKMRDTEGGLNLNMDQAKVAKLSVRGREAGKILRRRFGSNGANEAMNWNNHRWTRFKTAVPLLRKHLIQMSAAYASSEPDTTYPDYPQLIQRTTNDPATGYWWRPAGNRTPFLSANDDLVKAGGTLSQLPDASIEAETPKPVPELRTVPQL